MSEPRQPLQEGGLKRQPDRQPADHGLSKTGGGENRGDGVPEDEQGGMIGEADEDRDGGMAGEG